MNTDSLKSEIQQVLDQDLALRKEYSELKRSLSDYRNQLIMRDEDCKRLQVTIDVLNTKLLVMERDNTSYKAELNNFRELRETIDAQLLAKQAEIDERLSEIDDLRAELAGLSTGYENRINAIQDLAVSERDALKESYENQIQELRSTAYYRENGIREEYESRLNELSTAWMEKERGFHENQQGELENLRKEHESILESLRSEYNTQLELLTSTSQSELAQLRFEMDEKLAEKELEWTAKFNREHLYSEGEIARLNSEKELLVQEQNLLLEQKTTELIASYEEKLSNILIHSNAQNSKLNEELERLQLELQQARENLSLTMAQRESQELKLESMQNELQGLQNELVQEAVRYAELNSEFGIFKQNASLSDDEKINELNYRIQQLNEEMKHMGNLFEEATNSLAETEKALESRNTEYQHLKSQLEELEGRASGNENQLEMFKTEVQLNVQDELHSRHIEYQKLLVENEGLIKDIEQSQRLQEGLQAELDLLKNELEQLNLHNLAKAEDFRETLSQKNLAFDQLQETHKALLQESADLKAENARLSEKLLQQETILRSENQTLLSQISELRASVSEMEGRISLLNETNAAYEKEIAELKTTAPAAGQDDFIERLFKQIDNLNDQRLSLLDEKEQMAGQLLKMNEVIGTLSQQVDNESIDVSGLNNHRKNVILSAQSPSEKRELGGVKEQINNLVREIDKCIALLSA
ncbi:MAG TPA: hypothetical protein PLQ93_01100 [Bacteroidia bacterium]|nr:hypothetical protein [Bacteroidia bacterium]